MKHSRTTDDQRPTIWVAYTLVEIAIAVAIILVLSLAMVWVSSDNAAEKVDVDKRKMELIKQRIESYQVKHDAYPVQVILTNANGNGS